MHPRRSRLALVVALLTCVSVSAAESFVEPSAARGILEGRVLNAATGTYLENVRIRIAGTELETITDREGSYRLDGVSAGRAVVTASYIGLTEMTLPVQVSAGQVTRRDFELSLAGAPLATVPGELVKLDQVTVVAAREFSAQALALNEQRQAANIKNVVAADEYNGAAAGQLGDFLKFIPGVSAIYSGNLATDISVRGFPGFTTGVSINGGEVAAASVGESRNVQIYAVPLNNVSRIEVNKVPTPDMPASGLAAPSISSPARDSSTRPRGSTTASVAHSTVPGRSTSTVCPARRSGSAPAISTPMLISATCARSTTRSR